MVQGVGFRYTVTHQARSAGLTGWVRNLSDGRVEALVEGPKERIEELFKRVEEHFENNITDTKVEFAESKGEFQNFKIAR